MFGWPWNLPVTPSLPSPFPDLPTLQAMLRHCGRLARRQWTFRCAQQCHWEEAFGAQAASPPGPVPAGHQESDLSPTACHIGLGRRRSLLLRTDVRLHSPEGVHSLHDVLQV